MENHPEAFGTVYQCALRWMEACRDVVRRKAAALMENDLARLEDCLEEERRVIAQFSELKASAAFAIQPPVREKADASLALFRQSMATLAAEIRSLNRRNAVLVQTGLDFSRTLLAVMRPPATYDMMRQGDAPICIGPSDSIFSVEC